MSLNKNTPKPFSFATVEAPGSNLARNPSFKPFEEKNGHESELWGNP